MKHFLILASLFCAINSTASAKQPCDSTLKTTSDSLSQADDRMRIKELIEARLNNNNIDGKAIQKQYVTGKNNECVVNLTQSLSIYGFFVTKNLDQIIVPYKATESKRSWRCGSGVTRREPDTDISNQVIADLKIVNGNMMISNINDASQTVERDCGKRIADFLKSINNIPIK